MEIWSLLERAFGCGGVIAYHGVGEHPRLPVMHVSHSRLHAQLTAIKEHYHIVSIRELVRRWRVGSSTRDCVAITFDDAYGGVLTHALPILRSLDIPATVFVVSEHASIGGSFWWDDLERDTLMEKGWSETLAVLGAREAGADVGPTLDGLREIVLGRYAGRWPGGIAVRKETPWRSMTFDELSLLARDDRIEFGVHTVSHPALPLLSYREQVHEMRANFVSLRERLPRVLPVVAYPYGLYYEQTIRAAGDARMVAGMTIDGRST